MWWQRGGVSYMSIYVPQWVPCNCNIRIIAIKTPWRQWQPGRQINRYVGASSGSRHINLDQIATREI